MDQELLDMDSGLGRLAELSERGNYQGDQDELHVRFYLGAMQINTEERVVQNVAAGRKVSYDDVPFVEIQRRGEKDILRRPVWVDEYNRNADNHRWPEKWAAYLSGKTEKETGTRLADTPLCPPSLVAELAHQKIFTVEQLAAVSDGVMQHLTISGLNLKQKAKDFLALKKGDAPSAAVQAKFDAQEKRLQEMAEKLAQLSGGEKSKK